MSEKKVYVLRADDSDGGGTDILGVYDFEGKAREEAEKDVKRIIKAHYFKWLGECCEEARVKHERSIEIAARRLSERKGVAECCGDRLSWNEVLNLC